MRAPPLRLFLISIFALRDRARQLFRRTPALVLIGVVWLYAQTTTAGEGATMRKTDMPRRAIARMMPNDAQFPEQWALHNTGQSGSMTNRDVYAEKAWDITRGDSSVVIAVLDDGFEMTHPDLAANFFINPLEYGGGKQTNGVDDDGNGRIDDWRGWDFYNNDNDPSPVVATDSHGAQSAGLVAAVADNGEGVAGLAHGCRILPVRVVSNNRAVSSSAWNDAIRYAARFADVISIGVSMDTNDVSDALRYAVTDGRDGLGCVVCAALGNDGVFRRYSNEANAAPEVISVSGTSNYDRRSYFADYGPALGMMAPAGGGNISVFTTDRTGGLGYSTNDYAGMKGTSVAAPLAASAAALVISEHPSWTALDVRQVLEASCDKIDAAARPYNGRGWNAQYGFGRLNAWAALTTPQQPRDKHEPDNTTNAAAGIEDGELQYRSIEPGTDVDWVCVPVSNQVDLRLTIVGVTNIHLGLYSNGASIAEAAPAPYSILTVSNLNAGTYYARIASYSGAAVSNYGMHLAFLNTTDAYEGDNSTNTAQTIAPREMQYRSLYPAGDADWAKFALGTNATVYITTMGEWGGDTLLWLMDSATNVLAYNDDANTNTRYSRISAQLTAGAYYIRLEEYSGIVLPAYQVILETFETDANEPDNATNAAVSIVSGERAGRTLYPTGDVDWLVFTLTNEANALIMTDTVNRYVDADTVLSLYSNGVYIAGDDDGNGDGNTFSALYQAGLPPGVYHIKVEGKTSSTVCPNYYVALDIFEKQTAISSFAAATNGFQMSWHGDASFNYEILYGSNLLNAQAWIVAASNIEGRVGTNYWTDDGSQTAPAPGAAGARFYRLFAR